MPLLIAPVLAATVAFVAPPVRMEAGPATITFHRSQAVQRFHVIDMLSEWGAYSHKQYARALADKPATAITPEERRLLEEHVKLRRRLGGYGLLEKIYYRDRGWEEALDRAVTEGQITAAEAFAERALIKVLGPKVDALLRDNRDAPDHFLSDVLAHRAEVAAFAARVSRFCMGATVNIDAFLIASPGQHGGGGGASGGVLTVEVGADARGRQVLLHELWHAFVAPHNALVEAAAATQPGLDYVQVSEGMAHAIAPGLYDPDRGAEDALVDAVQRSIGAPDGWSNHRNRFNRVALAIRPLLDAALDDPAQTLATFLPRVVDQWRALQSLSLALDRPVTHSSKARCFVLGNRTAMTPVFEHVAALQIMDVWGRPAEERSAVELAARMRAGDRVILVVTAAEWSKLPAGLQRFVGEARVDLVAAAAAGASIEREVRAGDQTVLWLMAPDEASLVALGKKTTAVDRVLGVTAQVGGQ